MTLSDATPHKWTSLLGRTTEALRTESSVDFAMGPTATPAEALERASAAVSLALPRLLDGVPNAHQTRKDVQAVATELIDITARHQAGPTMTGRISYDGAHVTVSIGDMDSRLPAPEVEPGLYLVHRLAAEVGQHAGDHGGRVTWAAVPA
ncbi:hypothetical protein [Streptomyces sp. NPDC085937]|uniref:hypothetical protein n=1 Tax=Streptomyces sp. NPDC085937 TaxID=3365742 RepID=UPI0037D453DB